MSTTKETKENKYLGSSERLNQFLDDRGVERSGRTTVISQALNVSVQTARRMLNRDLPPKMSALEAVIEMYAPDADVGEMVSNILYNTKRTNKADLMEQKDVVLMGHVTIKVNEVAKKLGYSVRKDLDIKLLESLWLQVYTDAARNGKHINENLIKDLLGILIR